jgi:hypothetical protein
MNEEKSEDPDSQIKYGVLIEDEDGNIKEES